MIKGGFINFNVLDRQNVQLDLTHEDKWVRKMLERAAPAPEWVLMSAEEWAAQSTFQAQLELSRLAGGEEYMVEGRLQAQVPTLCAGCGEPYKARRQAEFKIYVHRTAKGEDQDSGDPDLLFVSGLDLNVGEILAEQLISVEPFAETPAETGEGPCQGCLQRPPLDTGQAPIKEANSPFSKLAVLKKGES